MADETPPLCKQCTHEEYLHKRPGMCLGLGDEKASLGSFCGCIGFKADRPAKNSYATYVPPPPNEIPRGGFRQSSSRNQLGDGRQVPRPNLQREQTIGGATPDWIMFGVRNADGSVTVFASTSLSYLDLKQEAGYFDDLHRDLIQAKKIAETPWDIRGRMVGYVTVHGPTYAEAIGRLFNAGWRPDGAPTTADLQREAALEEARHEAERDAQASRLAIAGPDLDDGIVDAEVVDDE